MFSTSYRIPPAATKNLLYGVGKSGNFDIEEAMAPVLKDTAAQVFSEVNTVKISEMRQQLTQEIQRRATEKMAKMFGVEIQNMQVTDLAYSGSFQQSVEQAAQAKNDAMKAENQTRQISAQAEQTRIQAQAAADAKKIDADAQAYATTAAADAKAHAITVQVKALGDRPGEVLTLEAIKAWDGKLPQTMASAGNGVNLLKVLPGDQR